MKTAQHFLKLASGYDPIIYRVRAELGALEIKITAAALRGEYSTRYNLEYPDVKEQIVRQLAALDYNVTLITDEDGVATQVRVGWDTSK